MSLPGKEEARKWVVRVDRASQTGREISQSKITSNIPRREKFVNTGVTGSYFEICHKFSSPLTTLSPIPFPFATYPVAFTASGEERECRKKCFVVTEA